ncbi:hypothetical protein BJ944DRAFT_263946 [Cunninghamella echinulata]|nr:hypothetical protein BJ944DRAFT_263946 [Cunninghamella echinulata]
MNENNNNSSPETTTYSPIQHFFPPLLTTNNAITIQSDTIMIDDTNSTSSIYSPANTSTSNSLSCSLSPIINNNNTNNSSSDNYINNYNTNNNNNNSSSNNNDTDSYLWNNVDTLNLPEHSPPTTSSWTTPHGPPLTATFPTDTPSNVNIKKEDNNENNDNDNKKASNDTVFNISWGGGQDKPPAELIQSEDTYPLPTQPTKPLPKPRGIRRLPEPEDGALDEDTLKRRKNTHAARKSRLKKLLHIEHLEQQIHQLQTENAKLVLNNAVLESDKKSFLAKEIEYKKRIKYLEDIVRLSCDHAIIDSSSLEHLPSNKSV